MRNRTHSSAYDPISAALEPPLNETEDARQARVAAETKATQISEQIDAQIEKDRVAQRRAPRAVKVLLLGAFLSARKSTTLKNFQLMASPKAFRSERVIWRAVIQLNVVRSIHLILNLMTEAHAQQTHLQNTGFHRPSTADTSFGKRPVLPRLSSEHLRLKIRLSPLVQVEEALVRRLQLSSGHDGPVASNDAQEHLSKEVAVHSSSGWKGNFVARILSKRRDSTTEEDDDGDGIDWNDPDDPGRIIHACGEDMIHLWEDPVVRQLLDVNQVRLQDMSGFFLDSLDRVTSQRYVPSDDDILRARIKTLGISEYRFTLETTGNVLERQWLVYDVGGHRSLVPKWAPYFDDLNAIIFLAPISCFDQVLEEDERVNRLEDSVNLWKSIVSNRLLAKTNMILFLNKCDILRQKLASGVVFGKYITSYGTKRPNDFESTATYLMRKFQGIFNESSPEKRPFFCNFTSVTDTRATHNILRDVTEIVLRENLNKSALVI
ncbi:guanine nucleotide binding protein, alpha subunit [Amylostereum chailletii]|nr:guanine nucleotide binding protein, alpha subunit [Amylostereum chailletii]